MKRERHTDPPEWLKGRRPPVKGDSPWWQEVARALLLRPDLMDTEVTIERLTEMVPCYPDGRRPRPRATARRLAHILELVERGPNGSRGKGATYRLKRPPPAAPEHTLIDDEWLRQSVERITGKK